MIGCNDCRHIFYPGEDDKGIKPRCHHPKSFVELPEVLTGKMQTVAHSIEMMRALGDCGPEAKLFESKAEER